MPRRKFDKNHKKLFEDNRKEKLKKLMNETNREYGEIVIKYAKDEPSKARLPFGIAEIDELTGNGGVHGNFIIIYGAEQVGKSTLALYQVAEAQKTNKICVYIDLEHSFDKDRAIQFGVNLDELLLIEAIDNAEQAMDIVISLAQKNVVDLIIIDSIQAMTPKAENVEKSGKNRMMEEDEIALLAKKMGKFLRRTATPIYKSKIGVTLIGQVRTGGIGGFAPHDELTGGKAQKHWSLITLHLYRGPKSESPTEKIEVDEVDEHGKKIKIKKIVGYQSIIKVEKVKISGCKHEGEDVKLPFLFKNGYIRKENEDEKEQVAN